jgi:hypothetical protein
MEKTKYIYIAGGALVVAMPAMLVLILRLDNSMDRVLLGGCWIVLLLLFLGLFISSRRLQKDYYFWKKRYDEELLVNVNELMEKTTEIALLKSKMEKMSHEVERLNRINYNYERTATSLRRELGSTRDKFDESCRLLADVRERAELGDKMKASLLANVSHELRTPLTSVLGFSAMINNNAISEKRRRHFIDVLNKSCNRFLDTLTDMIYYSQLQAGDIDVSPTVFEANSMLCSLRSITESKIAASDKNIQLVFTNDLSGKHYICGFEMGYYKILSKLLDNAVKFTNEGSITVSCESVGNRIRFEVSDTGIGFEPGMKNMLFGSFNQNEVSLSRSYEGLGLGLSICRGLVSLMNGVIDAESHPGVGSKFSFEVPLLTTPPDEVELYVKVENLLERYNDTGAVLVMSPYVEDYEFINSFFGSYGIEVIRCRSVEEVEITAVSKPGLNTAIIDLSTLPDTGLAAAESIFDKNPRVRFVFVSGTKLDDEAESKTKLYSDMVIQRPINSKALGSLLGGI